MASKWEVAEKSFLQPGTYCIWLERFHKNFFSSSSLSSFSQKHFYWLGLGAGGLPS
jgi:hypothetical protein